ncbi:hypothetical protein GCM10009610_47670 [Pseudonocardia xinjiangensis]
MVQRIMGHERSSTTLDLYTRRTDYSARILKEPLTRPFGCGRYSDRTSDLCGVKQCKPPARKGLSAGHPATRPWTSVADIECARRLSRSWSLTRAPPLRTATPHAANIPQCR